MAYTTPIQPNTLDLTYFPKYETVIAVNNQQAVTTSFLRAEAQTYYNRHINTINNYHQNTGGVTYAQAYAAYQALLTWATNSYVDSSNNEYINAYLASPDGVAAAVDLGTMNPFMAQSTELLRKLSLGMGVFASAATPAANTLTSWRSAPFMKDALAEAVQVGVKARIGNVTLLDTTTGAPPTPSSTSVDWYFVETAMVSDSIQHLIEAEYVRNGYDAIYAELNELNEAVTLNAIVLKSINQLQDIMNQKKPSAWRMLLETLPIETNYPNSDEGRSNFDKAMDKWEKDNFNADIPPAIGDPNAIETKVTSLINDLKAADPTFIVPPGSTHLLTNVKLAVAHLRDVVVGSLSPDLFSTLDLVWKDMNTVEGKYNTTTTSALYKWILDFETNSHTDGQYQNNLNKAAAASSSFNDTQRENMRKTMLLYEEFIKSAGAILSRISQIIEKFAGSISR